MYFSSFNFSISFYNPMHFINFNNLLVDLKIVGLRLKCRAYESGFIKEIKYLLAYKVAVTQLSQCS